MLSRVPSCPCLARSWSARVVSPQVSSVPLRLPSGSTDGDALAPESRVGRFVITRRLGAGAMGTVYEARDPDLSRNVALKILRESGQHHSLRFLREAQTLAQLQHPNVVVIHDVGVTGDAVFIAMELVEGENLREHLAGNALSWNRVLAIYVQAGRGLAAAHEKSIVHRDFKPANVLIDRQGRVRVTDFGLARLVAEDATDEDAAPTASFTAAASAATVDNSADVAPAAGQGTGLLGSPLTYDGALLGTPRYMAPEQHARRPATARSDQFAFCVSVWEAVFGAHPFPHGQGPDTKPTRSERSAPRWLVRALETGLAFDPARRHPTMDALLDALERAPRIRRRMWTAAGALAVVIAASSITLGARSTQDPCGGVAPLEAWTTEARVSTRNAFLATGLPFAGQIHDGVARRLDDYATRWHAMKVDTCRAHKSSSAALSEQRNLCLDRRQDEVGAMVAALRVITRDGVEKAPSAMDALGDLRACSDADALSRGAPLPENPVRAGQVRAIERDISAVEAQNSIGRPQDRSAKVQSLLAVARVVDYPPVLMRVLDLEAELAFDSDRWQDIVTLSQEELVAAEAAGDDRARFRIYTRLLEVNSARLQRYDDASQAGRLAEAILKRFGDEPALAAKLHCTQCMAEWYRGNYNESLALAKTCVAELERVVPRDEGRLGAMFQRKSVVESSLKRYDDALASANRAIELVGRGYGERHPIVAQALVVQADMQHRLGHDDVAESTLRRAISIMEEARGESSELASIMHTLANLLLDQDKLADAIALYRRVLAIRERTMGRESNRVADTLDQLGKALARSGHFDEGEALALRSIAIREANGNGNHPGQATAWRMLGRTYQRAQRYAKASDAFARSLRILEGKYGASHPLLVTSLLGIAEAELGGGHPDVARGFLERARRHLDAPEVQEDRALLQFLYAQALWATPRDRAQAHELADAALEIARADEDTELASEIEMWRKSHAAR